MNLFHDFNINPSSFFPKRMVCMAEVPSGDFGAGAASVPEARVESKKKSKSSPELRAQENEKLIEQLGLKDKAGAIRDFINSHSANSYEKGAWQAWNKDFASVMGVEGDDEAIQAYVRRVQRAIGAGVDGQVGSDTVGKLINFIKEHGPVGSPTRVKFAEDENQEGDDAQAKEAAAAALAQTEEQIARLNAQIRATERKLQGQEEVLRTLSRPTEEDRKTEANLRRSLEDKRKELASKKKEADDSRIRAMGKDEYLSQQRTARIALVEKISQAHQKLATTKREFEQARVLADATNSTEYDERVSRIQESIRTQEKALSQMEKDAEEMRVAISAAEALT